MSKDIWGQAFEAGQIIASASKSSDEMVMGVLIEPTKKTRVRLYRTVNGYKWYSHTKPAHMFSMSRTLIMPDAMVVEKQPELFNEVVKVRAKYGLKTNAEAKGITELEQLLAQWD